MVKIKLYLHKYLKVYLTLTITLLLVTSYTALGILTYQNSSIQLKKKIVELLMSRAADNADLVSLQMDSLKQCIEGVAAMTEIQSMDWDIQKPFLLAEAERLGIQRFQVADLTGFTRSSAGVTMDLSDRDHFLKALQGVTTITEPIKSKVEGQRMIVIAACPIKDKNKKIVGVLTATLDPQYLFNIIKDKKIDKAGYIFMIDNQGIIIAHPEDKLVLTRTNITRALSTKRELKEAVSIKKNMIAGETGFSFYTYNGISRCAVYTPVPDTSWSLCLVIPKEEVFDEVNSLREQFIAATLIVIMICLALSLAIFLYALQNMKVNELTKAADENAKKLNESNELEILRTQFFANLSHELRTPINVILGAIQLNEENIRNNNITDISNLKKYFGIIKQNCLRLLRLVNNLIDSTKIDAGFMTANMRNINIVDLIENITLSIKEYSESKGVTLVFDTEVEEKIIACDTDKMERIMLNLLSNAIKFTPSEGSIFVNIFDRNNEIIICVKDTGVGIPEEKQDIIFDRFRQVDESLSRNHEGSGIGLSLVKSFVEMQGGTISVKSEQGNGSEFIIELPARILSDEENVKYNNIAYSAPNPNITKINVEFSDIYFK